MMTILGHLWRSQPVKLNHILSTIDRWKTQVCFCRFLFWSESSLVQFFTGESMNPEGSIGLLDFREDGVTPYMLFFKDGLETEKCVSVCCVCAKHVTGFVIVSEWLN